MTVISSVIKKITTNKTQSNKSEQAKAASAIRNKIPASEKRKIVSKIRCLLLSAECIDGLYRCEVIVHCNKLASEPKHHLGLITIDLPYMPDEDIVAASELAALRVFIWDMQALNGHLRPEDCCGQPFHGKDKLVYFSNERPRLLMNVLWQRALDRETKALVRPPLEWQHIGKYGARFLSHFERARYSVMSEEDMVELQDLANALRENAPLSLPPGSVKFCQVYDAGKATQETHIHLPKVKTAEFNDKGLHLAVKALNEFRSGLRNAHAKLIERGIRDQGYPPPAALFELHKLLKSNTLIKAENQYRFKPWLSRIEQRLPEAYDLSVYIEEKFKETEYGANHFFIATLPELHSNELKQQIIDIKFLFQTDIERRLEQQRHYQNMAAVERGELPQEYLDNTE